MTTTLIDSPVANVANIARALRVAGAELQVTGDPAVIAAADRIVLPGVGSFIAAMEWLETSRAGKAIVEAVARGASLLGICVGHQLLFDWSYEHGKTRGLGLVRGEVRQFATSLPVPQIGWNRVTATLSSSPSPRDSGERAAEGRGSAAEGRGSATEGRVRSPLFDAVRDGTPFYFVNSYAAIDAPEEIAHAQYGAPFTAAVQSGRVFGVQFHPEKSSTAGLQVLRNFVAWK